MIIPNLTQILILLAVSLVCCCIGFKKFVWFLSIGYGLSVAGIGAALFVMMFVYGRFNLFYMLQCILLVAYGIRLGGFLLIRELKNEKYRSKLAEAGGEKKVPFFVAIVGWLFCGVFYLCQTAPVIYRFGAESTGCDGVVIAGIVISIIGLVLEMVADKQKSAQKATNPDLPAMEGLFRMCRCPNYFGEMVFWTGIFVSGVKVMTGWQWVIAVIGYAGIVYIMMSGAKRLEKRHIKHYGKNPDYIAYADKTPIIIPLIPLYHLVKEEK